MNEQFEVEFRKLYNFFTPYEFQVSELSKLEKLFKIKKELLVLYLIKNKHLKITGFKKDFNKSYIYFVSYVDTILLHKNDLLDFCITTTLNNSSFKNDIEFYSGINLNKNFSKDFKIIFKLFSDLRDKLLFENCTKDIVLTTITSEISKTNFDTYSKTKLETFIKYNFLTSLENTFSWNFKKYFKKRNPSDNISIQDLLTIFTDLNFDLNTLRKN